MTDILEELKNIPNSLEDINEDPILKPLSEFKKAISMLQRDEKAEKEYLETKMKKLKELLEKDIYDDSPIAQRYSEVFDVYQRYFMILIKYTQVADETILDMKDKNDHYYVLKTKKEPVQSFVPIRQKPKKEDIEKEVESFFTPKAEIKEEEIEEETEEEVEEAPKSTGNHKLWMDHVKKVGSEHPGLHLKEVLKIAKTIPWKKN